MHNRGKPYEGKAENNTWCFSRQFAKPGQNIAIHAFLLQYITFVEDRESYDIRRPAKESAPLHTCCASGFFCCTGCISFFRAKQSKILFCFLDPLFGFPGYALTVVISRWAAIDPLLCMKPKRPWCCVCVCFGAGFPPISPTHGVSHVNLFVIFVESIGKQSRAMEEKMFG